MKRLKKIIVVGIVALAAFVALMFIFRNDEAIAEQVGDIRKVELDPSKCPGSGTPSPCYGEEICREDDGCGTCTKWEAL